MPSHPDAKTCSLVLHPDLSDAAKLFYLQTHAAVATLGMVSFEAVLDATSLTERAALAAMAELSRAGYEVPLQKPAPPATQAPAAATQATAPLPSKRFCWDVWTQIGNPVPGPSAYAQSAPGADEVWRQRDYERAVEAVAASLARNQSVPTRCVHAAWKAMQPCLEVLPSPPLWIYGYFQALHQTQLGHAYTFHDSELLPGFYEVLRDLCRAHAPEQVCVALRLFCRPQHQVRVMRLKTFAAPGFFGTLLPKAQQMLWSRDCARQYGNPGNWTRRTEAAP